MCCKLDSTENPRSFKKHPTLNPSTQSNLFPESDMHFEAFFFTPVGLASFYFGVYASV